MGKVSFWSWMLVALVACEGVSNSDAAGAESWPGFQGAGAGLSILELATVYPRRFGTETLKADYDAQERLVLLLERSQEQAAPSASPVTVHRLTQFFAPEKGSQSSEWVNGVPRSLTTQGGGAGTRAYSVLRDSKQPAVTKFEEGLSESLFSDQVQVFTEGIQRIEVHLKRNAQGEWAEISRARSEIQPRQSRRRS